MCITTSYTSQSKAMNTEDTILSPPGQRPEPFAGSGLVPVVEEAIAAHKAWMRDFERAIGGIDADRLAAMFVADYNRCRLGAWLHAAEQDSLVRYALFRSIRKIHIDFHQIAGVILDHLGQGSVDEAQRLLENRLSFTSRLLVLLLEQFREPEAAAAKDAAAIAHDNAAVCRLERWLIDVEHGVDKIMVLIARSALALVRDMRASPEDYERVPYLFWLVEDLADECPDLWLFIEQGEGDCDICTALLDGKRHGMLLVT